MRTKNKKAVVGNKWTSHLKYALNEVLEYNVGLINL